MDTAFSHVTTGLAIGGGILAGAAHVLQGPDHLAALAPLCAKASRRAWAIGFRWGLGHSSGVVFVGAIGVMLKDMIDIRWLSEWGERFVGVMLIGIGLWGFRAMTKNRLHAHQHPEVAGDHLHYHLHAGGDESPEAHVHTHAAFAVGTLHGVAGGSHFYGVVPAMLMPSLSMSVLYLMSFAVGTIVSMMGFSTILGWVSPKADSKSYAWMMGSTSALSILVGLAWIFLPMMGIGLP